MLSAMDGTKTPLERAFELATDGKVKTIEEIRWLLKREGFDDKPLYGPSIVKQLRDLIRAQHANRT
jgi:hypothetical protein